jgi:subtilase family serine protease
VSLTGSNQFVGLLQFDGYNMSDITAYEAQAGLPNVPLINVLLDDISGAAGADNIEVALDIEMSIAMAPGLAGVLIYEGQIGDSILNRMATDNVAKQLSASWTFGIDATTTQIYQQFAAQGQSYFNASGDSDAYAGAISPPADHPWVTSVGGTTLSMNGVGVSYASEVVWNRGGNVGTGGGISTTYTIPSWQTATSMAANQGSTTMRNIPDVAMVADGVFVIYNGGTQGAVGGTSVASPLWAGFMALVNEQAARRGKPTIGFLNLAVYPIGNGGSYNSAFHDITTGNNFNSSSPSLFSAVAGYDLCTGWGSPNGTNLIRFEYAVQFSGRQQCAALAVKPAPDKMIDAARR